MSDQAIFLAIILLILSLAFLWPAANLGLEPSPYPLLLIGIGLFATGMVMKKLKK